MAGSNQTGKVNSSDYHLDGGCVFLADLDAFDVPGEYRLVGNVVSLQISAESEVIEHFTSKSGTRVKDAEAISEITADFELVLDELNYENLATFWVGDVGTHTNASGALAQVLRLPDESNDPSRPIGGRHYDITARGLGAIPIPDLATERMYDMTAEADVEIIQDPAGSPTTFVGGVDFDVDLDLGTLFITKGSALDTALIAAAASIGGTTEYVQYPLVGADGFEINIITTGTPAATLDEYRALTKTAQTFAMKFKSINGQDNGKVEEVQFHKVKMRPSGDLNMLNTEEFTELTLAGTLESNVAADADSGFLTGRTVRS